MDQLGQHLSDLSIEAERKVAITFMGRIEWEMIVIGLGQFTLWIATWVLVIVGTIPLYVGFLLALFTACNAYLPSHAGQHSHLSGGKKNLQWLDYWIGQISLIQLTQPHEILKATHLKHHAHTNDPDNDPDFFHGNAKNWWEAAVSANVAYNNDGPAMKVISKHIEDDPKFKKALEKGGSWVFLFFFAQIILAILYPIETFLLWWVPKRFAASYLGIVFSYYPHSGLDKGRYKNTRFWTNRMPRFLNHSMQIHTMHHMYPRICHYDEAKAIEALKPFMIERGMPGAEYIPEKLRWNPVTYIKEVYFGGR
ncbi:MAG: fatty acid desaturase [SAR86 cluster bacterium]|jgi:beta-carotene hydroxylase|nr:fatty acid desaturase [SAR86 cluster bacterium]|tara:strand:+ start:233 stop:1159 length:927 start_codon:yes stop_codon:yes gene_type:complete